MSEMTQEQSLKLEIKSLTYLLDAAEKAITAVRDGDPAPLFKYLQASRRTEGLKEGASLRQQLEDDRRFEYYMTEFRIATRRERAGTTT